MSNPYATAAALTRKYLIPDGGPRPLGKAPEPGMGFTGHKRRWGNRATMDPIGHAKRDVGPHRRFFWRVRQRVGPGWDKLPPREIEKLLRQMSWRRPL